MTFDTIHTDGQRSCTIPLFIAAAKGKTSVFERKTVVCPSGKAGFGQFLGERFMVQSSGENGKVK